MAVAACPDGEILHASCVAVAGRGLLIAGASGSGKSALALDLMAFGATLVADDRVCLQRAGAALLASAPPTIAGLIEARGIGLLRARAVTAPVPVAALIDLDRVELRTVSIGNNTHAVLDILPKAGSGAETLTIREFWSEGSAGDAAWAIDSWMIRVGLRRDR